MSVKKKVRFTDAPNITPTDSKVILNVGGVRFETQRATLKKLPATRLSRLTPQLAFYDPIHNEYFFDRHPGVFSQILNYYRTGRLHYPNNVCGPLFEDELSYWGIQREEVEPCCWMTYTKHRSTQETLQVLDSLELDTDCSSISDLIRKFNWEDDFDLIHKGRLATRKRLQSIIWQLFEEPRSSIVAKIIAFISMLFIFLSITTFVLRTLPMFEISEYDFLTMNMSDNRTDQISMYNRNHGKIIDGFELVEWICNSWFIFELTLRFIVSPSKRIFCTSILNLIDFLGIFWFFVTYLIYNTFHFHGYRAALDLISTIRVARMFKLCNLHPRLKVIVISMSCSSSVLSLLLFFFFLAVMTTGSVLYFIERIMNPSDNSLISIIEGIWLAISTISTLGFGDTTPKSLAGMIFGAISTVMGVLIIDLPMPIIVETFANFNSHLQARQQLPKQRRRITQTLLPRKIGPQILSNVPMYQRRF